MSAVLSSITGRMAVISRTYDVATLDAYIGSQKFLQLYGELPPTKRPSVFAAYQTARTNCLKRKPVAAPKQAKADWKKPGEIERFKRAWLKHGGNKLLVAHEMGITEGAVSIARSRFIVHGATATYVSVKNASRKPQDGQHGSRPPLATRPRSESVGAVSRAA